MSVLRNKNNTCCAVGCSMRSGTNFFSKVRLFPFPKDSKRRQLWELAVKGKNWSASRYSRLCNFHFVTGEPSSNESHRDYVPTIFKHRQQSINVEQKLSRSLLPSVKRRQIGNGSLILDNVSKRRQLWESVVHWKNQNATENSGLYNFHFVTREPSSNETLLDYVLVKPRPQSTNVEQEPSQYDHSVKRKQLKGRSLSKKGGMTCCAVGCTMRSGTNLLSEVRMFTFPKDPTRRHLWESAVHRQNWKATQNSRLCNFHFVTGKPSSNETHPDYVPSVFKHRSTNVEQKLSRYNRAIKRRQVESESLISDNVLPVLRPRLKPCAVPSLYLPVTDNFEKSTKKYQVATKRHASSKVSNRSVTHSPTTVCKSNLLNKPVNKLEFDPTKASEKDLKHSTAELWKKNETLKKNIEHLQNKGYKEEHLKWYADALQEHKYLKDLAKRLMERLADIQNTTFTNVQEEFGMK